MNLSTTFFSQAVSALTVLILIPILLHQLGTAEFALYGIIINVVGFSAVFDFGLNLGLLKRLISKEDILIQLINSIFFFFIGVTLIAIGIYFFVFHQKMLHISDNILLFSLITGVIVSQNMIALFFDMLIQSANKIFLGRIIRLIKLLIELIVLLMLAHLKSLPLLFAGTIVINFLYILALQYYSKKEVSYSISLRYFNIKILIDHIKYCSWYFLNSIAIVLVFNTQVMLINQNASSESVAKYLLVTRFYDVIRIGISNFMVVLFPKIAIIQSEGNWVEIKQTFFKAFTRIFLLAFIILLLNLFVVKQFFVQWSKFNDAEIINLFVLFGLFIFIISIDNVSATFLSALKLNRAPTIVSIFQGLIGLALGYFLLPKYGITGIAVALIIALSSTSLIFNPYYLLKKIRLHIQNP
jgi:O-antigen/teichoic acid export membrane protein